MSVAVMMPLLSGSSWSKVGLGLHASNHGFIHSRGREGKGRAFHGRKCLPNSALLGHHVQVSSIPSLSK